MLLLAPRWGCSLTQMTNPGKSGCSMLSHFTMPFASSVHRVDQKDLADQWIMCFVPCQSTSEHYKECPSPPSPCTNACTLPLGGFWDFGKIRGVLYNTKCLGLHGPVGRIRAMVLGSRKVPPSLPCLLPADTHKDSSSLCRLAPASTQLGREPLSGPRS